MKIDTKDIRQRLSENTAIDAKEIQALCDEVEVMRKEPNGNYKDYDFIMSTKTGWYERLFEVFSDYGLTLTQTEISDIMLEVHNVSYAVEKPIKELNGE